MKAAALPPRLVEVRRAGDRGLGGRGVFAVADIPAGTVIERSPVLLIPKRDFGELRGDEVLLSYVFDWPHKPKKHVCLGLGCLSLYNHQTHANATWSTSPPDLMLVTAVRDIAAGEEVTIHYHGEPGDEDKMPFDVNP